MAMQTKSGASKIVIQPVSNPIEYAIPPASNPPIYQWHKFWGRKPHNVVRAFIESYCPPDGIVLDPFVGSGVTAIEALRINRRAIVCDLIPTCRDIILTTINPPDPHKYDAVVARFIAITQDRTLKHYEHSCISCKGKAILLAVSVDAGHGIKPLEFRYKCKCTKGLIRETAKEKHKHYFNCYSKQLACSGLWWPEGELCYSDGHPFKERQKYIYYHDLFTPRNLLALATMWDVIEHGPWEPRDRQLLEILFRSTVHLGSRVSGDRRVRPLSSGWTQHSFWFARNPVEVNVWFVFERKLNEYRNVINNWHELRAKPVKIARTMEEVLCKKADIFIATRDCGSFLRDLARSSKKADYVFTDPPYNGLIQYGELSYMWNAWQGDNKDAARYIRNIERSELTENKGQHKELPDYYQHLRGAFQQIRDAVKPGSYIHVTYCSPKVKYRNLTLRAARLAGLEFDKLHFQQSKRVSKKAIDQPFGSVFGDFIFTFYKPLTASKAPYSSKASFAAVIEERTTYMLKHRGEPTPLLIIVAECERELFKAGFFDDDDAIKVNVQSAIKKNKKFKYLGSDKVTFTDKQEYAGTPLSLRVEKTVKEMLTASRVVNYTDVWSALLIEYPNSLTPDSAQLSDALKKYAYQKVGGIWEAKPGLLRGKSSLHNRTIYYCAEAALSKGYEIAIGKPESSDQIFKRVQKQEGNLEAFLSNTYHREHEHLSSQARKRLRNVDLVTWKKENGLFHRVICYEVETSTNFIDAFERVEPLLNFARIELTLVFLIGARFNELKNKIRTKMTFQRIPHDLKKIARIIEFDAEKVESIRKWSILSRRIKHGHAWLELESQLLA